MTREEAIEMLIHTKEFLMSDKICWSKYDCHIEAIDMAIDALKREARFLKDLEDNTPTDLIIRTDAIEAMCGECLREHNETECLCGCSFKDALSALPSADRPSEERMLKEIKHLREQNNQLSELYTALSVNTKGDNE